MNGSIHLWEGVFEKKKKWEGVFESHTRISIKCSMGSGRGSWASFGLAQGRAGSSRGTYLLIGFRKSNPPQNRNLLFTIFNSNFKLPILWGS